MRILVIEDNPEISDLIRMGLDGIQEEQVFVQNALTLERAINALIQRRFDIICYDPSSIYELSPIEGFNRLRKVAPETPIVAISGAYDHQLNVALSEIGTRYIPKSGLVAGALYSLLLINEQAFKSKIVINLNVGE